MSEYTKGPWRLGLHGSVVADYPVPGLNGSDAVDYYGGHLIAESITPSNARLIAAAPEMLEALESALEWLYDFVPEPQSGPIVDKCEAAIAQATGK